MVAVGFLDGFCTPNDNEIIRYYYNSRQSFYEFLHTRRLPFFFATLTMELIQAVGLLTAAINSCFSRSSVTSFTCSLTVTGTRRGAYLTGSTVLLTLICCSPASCPTPSPKTLRLGYFLYQLFVRYRYMCLLLCYQ